MRYSTVLRRAAGMALVFAAATAHAEATFIVDTTADLLDDDTSDGVCHTSANTCSLRAATMQANRSLGAGATIMLPAGHYVLARPPQGSDDDFSGDLNFTKPSTGTPVIHLVGAGAATTIIDADQIDRVLTVEPSRIATISGVTLKNGFRNVAPQSGGGILNKGTLTLTQSVVENNFTNSGGGGINNAGVLNVATTTIRGNRAYLGGAIFVNAPTHLRDSTLSDNGATYGGAVEISAFAAVGASELYAVNTTFAQNYADVNGGGIDNEGSTFLYNCTVVDNDSDHDHDELGGIGGGVYVNTDSRVLVVNTLIARNTVMNTPAVDDCHGVLESYGFNLLDDGTGCFTSTSLTTIGFISPSTFGGLQDNGGPTMTVALLSGSQAINAAPATQPCIDENGTPLPTDQRGGARVVGGRCDVGAFEYGAAVDRIFASTFE